MKMPRLVVLDTNVLIAGMRSSEGASFRLLEFWKDKQYEIAVSVPLVLEYETVLMRQKKELGLTEVDIANFLDYVCSHARHTSIHYLWRPRSRDVADDMVIELAVAASVQGIVSFNTKDLQPATSLGVKLLSPPEFLKLLTH